MPLAKSSSEHFRELRQAAETFEGEVSDNLRVLIESWALRKKLLGMD